MFKIIEKQQARGRASEVAATNTYFELRDTPRLTPPGSCRSHGIPNFLEDTRLELKSRRSLRGLRALFVVKTHSCLFLRTEFTALTTHSSEGSPLMVTNIYSYARCKWDWGRSWCNQIGAKDDDEWILSGLDTRRA
ncbi:hypothetical protein C8R44DRAFT_733149 [Mycena epipterygia]|nr:hypothetical protein C8R44DRAFT_733149 [Mycena epipterygia]